MKFPKPTEDPFGDSISVVQDVTTPRSPRTEAGKRMLANWQLDTSDEASADILAIEAEAAAPRSGEDEAYRRGFTDGRGEPPERGTVTQCPIEGVHEHAFRGPHGFREWLGASREASEPKFEMVHAGSWTREYLRRKAAPREASEPPST